MTSAINNVGNGFVRFATGAVSIVGTLIVQHVALAALAFIIVIFAIGATCYVIHHRRAAVSAISPPSKNPVEHSQKTTVATEGSQNAPKISTYSTKLTDDEIHRIEEMCKSDVQTVTLLANEVLPKKNTNFELGFRICNPTTCDPRPIQQGIFALLEAIRKSEPASLEALSCLADVYFLGRWVQKKFERNLYKAIPLAFIGSNKGESHSSYILGYFYKEADDHLEAIKYFKLAVAQGHPESLRMLRDYYKDGAVGVEKNIALSERYAKICDEFTPIFESPFSRDDQIAHFRKALELLEQEQALEQDKTLFAKLIATVQFNIDSLVGSR